MKVAVLRESFPGERRVSLVPSNLPALAKAGLEIVVEAAAGEAAGFRDSDYQAKGATIVADRGEAIRSADILLHVRVAGANPQAGAADAARYRLGQVVIGQCDPLGAPEAVRPFAKAGLTLFALELVPRITRAQAMDVLSSQATIAGYRAVLLAAAELPKLFPLLMTAAGTITAARVFVIGAGVAGLQAIATSRRLGAVVSGYDLRPVCREQVESLGAKFVELKIDSANTEDKGGYAKAMDEEFYRRQRDMLGEVISASNVVITTAAIPGKKSPLLITADAVRRMAPGSVIVDLAAERGGNCELSRPDERVNENGVTILAPTNLPSELPYDASVMYGNNVTRFLLNMVSNNQLAINTQDEIIRDTMITRGGEIAHTRIRELLGMSASPVVEDPVKEPYVEPPPVAHTTDVKNPAEGG